jgi:hypothetical protein
MDEDTAALGILPPTFVPRATEYVPHMLSIIEKLEEKGLAYQGADGDVNYAVRDFPGYGKLSGKSLDDLRAGERVDVNTGKRDPLDFVLWKAGKESEPAEAKWDSKWGIGRPGWHIECSAMSCAMLGEHFDIHGGGADLQFPHHENEIAQSEGAFGAPMANYWIHNGFVRVDNEKMSKSLGNFFTIRDVLKKYDAEVVRFFILRAHYRSPLNYSDAHIDDAKGALTRLYTALSGDVDLGSEPVSVDWDEPHAQRFREAMDDDFNTPLAVAELFDLASEVNKSKSLEGRAPAESPGRRAGPARALARRNSCRPAAAAGGMDEAAIDDAPSPPRRRQESAQLRRGRRDPRRTHRGRHRPGRQAGRHDQLAPRMMAEEQGHIAGRARPALLDVPPYWAEAKAELMRRDRIMNKLIPQFGDLHLRGHPDPFTTLARSIVGQQVTVKAADAAWASCAIAVPEDDAGPGDQGRRRAAGRLRPVQAQDRIHPRPGRPFQGQTRACRPSGRKWTTRP